MLTTTLNRIRAHRPCADGWTTLLDYLGKTAADDDAAQIKAIIEGALKRGAAPVRVLEAAEG